MPSRCATRKDAAFSVPKLSLCRTVGSGDLYVSMQLKHEVLIDRSTDRLDAMDALRITAEAQETYVQIKNSGVNTCKVGLQPSDHCTSEQGWMSSFPIVCCQQLL